MRTTIDTTAQLADARARLAGAPSRSCDANNALADLEMFDPQIQRGALATFAGDLRTALALGGLADLAYTDESVDDVREALRAYGNWLLAVAETAR